MHSFYVPISGEDNTYCLSTLFQNIKSPTTGQYLKAVLLKTQANQFTMKDLKLNFLLFSEESSLYT